VSSVRATGALATRARILDAAADFLRRHPVSGFSLEAVACALLAKACADALSPLEPA
jgi:AcrR family transcriptional regulator